MTSPRMVIFTLLEQSLKSLCTLLLLFWFCDSSKWIKDIAANFAINGKQIPKLSLIYIWFIADWRSGLLGSQSSKWLTYLAASWTDPCKCVKGFPYLHLIHVSCGWSWMDHMEVGFVAQIRFAPFVENGWSWEKQVGLTWGGDVYLLGPTCV